MYRFLINTFAILCHASRTVLLRDAQTLCPSHGWNKCLEWCGALRVLLALIKGIRLDILFKHALPPERMLEFYVWCADLLNEYQVSWSVRKDKNRL